MRRLRVFILFFSVLMLVGCTLFSKKDTEETTNTDEFLAAPTGSFINHEIEDNTIRFSVNVNDNDDTIIGISILLKHNDEVIDEITVGINTNGLTENLLFTNLENKIYKLVLVTTYNDGELRQDIELASFNFTISEEDVEPIGSIMDFNLNDDVVNFSVEIIDISQIISMTKVVLKRDTETISEITSGISFNGKTESLSFINLEQNTSYLIELTVSYTFNDIVKTEVIARESFTTGIWLGAAISTSIKLDGVTFTFEVENENKVKVIKVVNIITKQEYIVENNSITIPVNYNQTYSFEIILVDNNDVEIILRSLTIKPGSSMNPYEISNVDDLKNINSNLEAVYKLTDHIDLINEEWEPISLNVNTAFKGILDGNGYEIKNLTMEDEQEFAGLFGYNNGEIRNIKLVDVNINIEGSTIGAIAVGNIGGTIKNSLVSGQISGKEVGGISALNINYNNKPAIITNCYTNVTVSGRVIGGIVSRNHDKIENSYAYGDVVALSSGGYAYSEAGGLVGVNDETGVIRNSYATGDLTSTVEYVYQGGLVGTNIGEINNSFATGDIEATNYTGGLVGRNGYNYPNVSYGEINNSFRFMGQIVKSKRYKNVLGNDMGISELTSSQWYRDILGWDSSWNLSRVAEGFYPVQNNNESDLYIPTEYRLGSSGNPIEITTKQELIDIKEHLYYSYKLLNDIDLEGEDWIPIGDIDNPFIGEFDGNGFKITNLSITRNNITDIVSLGLFGKSLTLIKNVKLENIFIQTNNTLLTSVGGIAGTNEGFIVNSYVTGTINDIDTFTIYSGGLVGENIGSISNSYADVNITAVTNSRINMGGLVGRNSGIIENSFSLGDVSGDGGVVPYNDNVGGLVGYMTKGEINNCFTLSNVKSGRFAGRLVGYEENIDNYITNSYYYENQTVTNMVGDEKTPVDDNYANVLIASYENLNEVSWYKDTLSFSEEIWDLSQIPKILFEDIDITD